LAVVFIGVTFTMMMIIITLTDKNEASQTAAMGKGEPNAVKFSLK